jgi:Thioesterase-like superfamily
MTDSGRALEDYYGVDGAHFLPSALCASPWRPDAQNGVALGLLMAQTLEAEIDPAREQLARFTLDILHPAPFAPTCISWRLAHADARVRLFEGALEARGVKAVRGSAVVVAAGKPASSERREGLTPPDEASDRDLNQRSGLSVRMVKGKPQAAHVKETVWVRVDANIAAGRPASHIATAIAAADTGAISLSKYRSDWEFPNLDVAVHFVRPPQEGWLRVDTEPMMLGAGICVINHRISDGAGPCARAHQTLFFSHRRRESA